MSADETAQLRGWVAQVAAAYLHGRELAPDELPRAIDQIAKALLSVSAEPAPAPAPATSLLTPEQIAASIRPDTITSFEDGHGYRSLKPHLAARGLTPDEYRAKWGLPKNYPMVAEGLSLARSRIAKNMQLGGRFVPNKAKRRPEGP